MTAPTKARQGIAILVVLGAIVLFTLLGYVALTLSRQDNSVAGNLVDIKSQQVASLSGLNLAIARFQKDPNNAVAGLNEFLANTSKAYVDFDASGKSFALVSSEAWHPIGDGEEEILVKVLGISAGSTSGTSGGGGVRIALSCKGKGRDGNVHEMTAIYNIRGVDFEVQSTTTGPNYAFQVQGTLGQIHVGNLIDGSVYSGSSTGTTVIENNASAIRKIKFAGNITTHQSLHVNQPSIIGGKLFLDDKNTLTFDSSLLVQGGMFVSGTLKVDKSLLVGGGTEAYLNNGALQVADLLWIQGNPLNLTPGSSITVGSSATNAGLAVLDNGAFFGTGAASNVYGSLYVLDTLTIDQTTVNVSRDFEYSGTKLLPVAGQLNVTGNGYLGGEPHPYWNAKINVGGSSVLMKAPTGYRILWGWPSAGDGTITLTGSSWIYGTSLAKGHGGLAMRFGSTLSLNGSLGGTFKDNTNWSFLNASTSPATWSANVSGLAVPSQPVSTMVGFSKGFTTRTSNEAQPTVLTPRVSLALPSKSQLNFSSADLNLSPSDPSNAPSTFSLTANSSFTKVRDDSKWETIKAEYLTGSKKTWCADPAVVPGGNAALGSYGMFPSAAMLNCIYAKEKNLGAASTHLWNKEYLVIWLPPTWADGNNKWMWTNTLTYTADHKVGSIETGVKIFYVVQQPGGTTSWEFYNNKPGSVQILYSEGDMTNFCWTGDFYGYIYFNYSGTGDQMFNGDKEMNLIGSWENTNTSNKVWFSHTNGSPGKLSITNRSTAAQNVFSDIASNFRASAAVGSTPIIRFNSDQGSSSTGTKTLKLFDGWVQFERIGEFR